MKRIIATVIAGLFASAAFAQTPAPAPTTTPDSATPPAVAKAEAAHDKLDVKAGKKHVGKVKHKKKAEAKDAAAATTAPAATK
jgi:hypothetical protein